MKIEKLFKQYLEVTKYYKPNDTYLGELSRFKSLLIVMEENNINDTDQLDDFIIIKLIDSYKKRGVKNSTINTRIGMLYASLKYFNIKTNLTKQRKLKDDTQSFNKVSDSDVNKILRYLSKIEINDSPLFYIKCAIFLMLETGVRLNELRHIQIKNIDLQAQRILLTKTKNNKNRIVPFSSLSETVLHHLIKYNYEYDYLFFNKEKNSIWTSKKISYWLNIVKASCDIEKLHPHQFRKTFATKLLVNGCSIHTIMRLLGHSSLSQTLKYLKLDNTLVFKDYEKHKIDYKKEGD